MTAFATNVGQITSQNFRELPTRVINTVAWARNCKACRVTNGAKGSLHILRQDFEGFEFSF
jgi:hypothetical protein